MKNSATDALHDAARVAAVEMLGLHRVPPEEAFDRLTALAARVLQAPMAFFTVLDDDTQYFKSKVGVGIDRLPVDESFCQYVVNDRAPFVTGAASLNERSKDNPSIVNLGIHAYAGAPVRNADGFVVGAFCVADGVERTWSVEDVATLTALAEVAANEIVLRETLTLASEFASTLQRSLLPPTIPPIPGVDVSASYVPAHDGYSVLGDFYDVFPLGPDRWQVVIGDVCGHGPLAAETVSLARWSIRAEAARTSRPDEMLSAVNDLLQRRPSPDALHLTCLIATVRTADGVVEADVASAGHPSPLIRRPDGTVEVMDPGGPPLGVVDDIDPPMVTVGLEPGTMMVLLTDGVTEAGRPGPMLGQDGIAAVLEEMPTETSAAAAVDAIFGAVADRLDGPPEDDLATLALYRP